MDLTCPGVCDNWRARVRLGRERLQGIAMDIPSNLSDVRFQELRLRRIERKLFAVRWLASQGVDVRRMAGRLLTEWMNATAYMRELTGVGKP